MNFYQQSLTYFINKHHAVQIESKRIANLLFIIYYLQLCGYLLDVEEEHFYAQTLINLLKMFQYINKIFKPYKYLLEFKQFRLYGFLVPGLLLLIQQIGFIFDLIRQKFQQKINKTKPTYKKKGSLKETQKILSILFQTHIYLFSLFSVDLMVVSIREAYSSDLCITILSSMLLIFEILFVLINITSSQSVEFVTYSLRQSQPLKIHYATFLFIILSIVLSYQDIPEGELLKHIVNCFIFGIYLKIQITKKLSMLQRIVNIILSLAFTYNLIGLMFVDNFPEIYIGVVIILCPFLINILSSIQEKQNQIDFSQNRGIQQIYNNLQLIQQKKQEEETQQLDILIMIRMKSDFGTDPFRSELRLLNQKILASQNLSKVNWYLKYISIKISTQECAEALSLVHNLQENLLFCELQKRYVKYLLHFTFIQKLQIEQIKSQMYERIYQTIERDNQACRIQSSCFIDDKLTLIKLRQNLYTLFTKKEQIYYLFLDQKQSNSQRIIDSSLELIYDALTYQSSLQAQLKSSKTFHIKQMLIILYVEFLNKIASAEELKNSEFQNEEPEQIYFDQMDYLGMKISSEESDVCIFDVSTNFMKTLGYKKLKGFKEIIFRNFFSNEYYDKHQNEIKQFLQIGKNKLVEKIQSLYIRGSDEIYYETSFLLTFLSNYDNGLTFYCFSKVSENQPKSLFISKQHKIVGLTTSFLKFLNELNPNYTAEYIVSKDISKYIKNFRELPLNRYLKQTIFGSNNQFILFLKQQMNMIELQIIEDIETIQNNEESVNQSLDFQPNQESEVIIPILSSDEDLQFPKLTLIKRENNKLYESYTQKFLILNSKLNSEQQSELINDNQQQYMERNMTQQNYQRDKQSSKLSRGFLDQAIYYQKYIQLEKFLGQTKKQILLMLLFFALTALIVNFCFQMICIIYVLPQYSKVNQDADSLSVKSYFLTPIHSCTASQYSSLAYLLYVAYKLITPELYLEKVKFSQDSVQKSFNFLQSSFKTQLNNQNLQSFFIDETLEIEQIEGSQLVFRNISLKNALYYYYESQFFIIYANGNKSSQINTDFSSYVSNNFVYYSANILIVDDYFNNLSQKVLESVTARTVLLQNDYTELFLKLLFLQMFCFFFVMAIILKIFSIRSKVWKMFGKLNIFATNQQLQSIIKIKYLLNQEKGLQFYSFDLPSWEKKLQQVGLLYNLKLNQTYIKPLEYHQPSFRIFIVFIILNLIFLTPILVLESLNKIFLQKYQNSCELLKQLSEVSSAIVAVYELKETNYLISGNSTYFYFFTDDKRLKNNEKILAELLKIQQFQQNLTQIQTQLFFLISENFLVNYDFINLIEQIQNSNLCNYLIHFSKDLALEHCNIVYQGVMNLGLVNTISEIYSKNIQEYENTKGFQLIYRQELGPFEELEAALITSDAIFFIQETLYKDIITQTEQMLVFHKIINYCYLIIDLVVAFIIIFFLPPKIFAYQKLIRNLIFLIPKEQLYMDQKFETEFRWLVRSFN